eukprot:gene10025-2344_t
MEFSKKQLITSVCEFLENEEQKDTFTVASDILKASKYYDETSKPSKSLLEIFEAGVKALGIEKKPETKPQKDPLMNEEKFQQFLKVIADKGYFKNVETGTPEYKERYEKAKEKFLTKQRDLKKKADEFKDQGNSFLEKKDYDEAIKSYQSAIQTFPSAVYYSNLSAACNSAHRFEEGLEAAYKAVELEPEYAKGYGRLGTIYLNMDAFQSAIENFETALSYDPNNKSYQSGLSKAKERLKKSSGGSENQQGLGGMDFGSILSGAMGGQGAPSMDQMSGLLNNPEFMNMAMGMMQQPGFKDIMGNMMQQMNVNPNISSEVINEIKQMDDYQNSSKVQSFVSDLESKGMSAIYDYMGDPEVQQFIMKISKTKFSDGSSPFDQVQQ